MRDPEEDVRVYEVKPGDTLCSIAAHFGYITPTQLVRINRLSLIGFGLPHVFPGQTLIIPTLSKGVIDPIKVRRAPGSALRVRTSLNGHTIDQDTTDHHFDLFKDFNVHGSHTVPSFEGSTEERRFIKVSTQHVLSPTQFVNGILLITPDTLCFDATKATHTERQLLTESPNESSLESPNRTALQPENLHALNFCISLDSLISMSTLRSLDDEQSIQSPSGSLDSRPPDNRIDHVVKKEMDTTNPTTADLNQTTNLVVNTAVSTNQSVEFIELDDISPSAKGEDHPTPHSTCPGDDQVKKEEEGGKEELEETFLFLQLIQLSDKSRITHRFRISVSKLPEVLSFLLHAGIESAKSHVPYSQKDSRKSSGTTRRSLIVEALENMENSSILPSLYDGVSTILTDSMLEELATNLPTHWVTSNFRFVYSTEQDGYSLSTIYRKSNEVEGGVLLVIRDTMNTVFGALMSENMHPSKHFYGTGETCVFHWSPTLKRYDWTRKNSFFMRGSSTSFQIGGQSGRNAIWFDGALKYGRSEPTDTFDNPVLSGVLQALRFDKNYTHYALPPSSAPNDTGSTTSPPPSTATPFIYSMDSVPFIIDRIEVWELIS